MPGLAGGPASTVCPRCGWPVMGRGWPALARSRLDESRVRSGRAACSGRRRLKGLPLEGGEKLGKTGQLGRVVNRCGSCQSLLAALQAYQTAVERRRFSAATAAEQAPTMPPISPRPGVSAAVAAGAAGAAAGFCSTQAAGSPGRRASQGWAALCEELGGGTRRQAHLTSATAGTGMCTNPQAALPAGWEHNRAKRLPKHVARPAHLLGLLGGRRLFGCGGLLDCGRSNLVMLARASRLLAGAAAGCLLGAGRLRTERRREG